MKLDRNIPDNNGGGKYGVLKLRVLRQIVKENGTLPHSIKQALEVLEAVGAIDYGIAGSEDEFFLIRLKDRFALTALNSYAEEAESFDPEYAHEIAAMAARSGPNSVFCKLPD